MSNFSPEQQTAIEHKDGNMVVISAAGSGKTTVIVNRVVALIDSGVNPKNILCITFSKKAKENMIERLRKLIGSKADKVNIETFHSLALKIIKDEAPRSPFVYTNIFDKQKAIRAIITTQKMLPPDKIYTFNVANFLFWIGTCKNKMFAMKQKKEIMSDPTLKELIPENKQGEIYFRLWNEYEEYKKKNNYIEFDDMVNMAVDMLNVDSIRKKYSRQFQYILSDEYQDTSMNRALFIKLLGDKAKDVFVVGDALQCIFGFTGADNHSIMEFDKEYNAEVVHMNTNYRSVGSIINLANKFAETMEDSKHRNYKPVVAFKDKGNLPKFKIYDSDKDEAEAIADEINHDIKTKVIKPNEIAILSRTNAQLGRIQMSLFKRGIKFTLVDGTGFTALREVRFILNYMRVVHNQKNDFAFEQIFNMPTRWLDKVFLAELKDIAKRNNDSLYGSMNQHPQYSKFRNGIRKLQDIIEHMKTHKFESVGEYVKYIRQLQTDGITFEDFLKKDVPSEEQDDIADNLDMLETICNDFKSLGDCIQYFSSMNAQFYKDEKEEVNEDKVSLMSIHKSKGLEFPRVYIIGTNEDILPHQRNNDLEAEKRLFYVGITRAMEDLRLSSCRTFRKKLSRVSSFMDGIMDLVECEDYIKKNVNTEENNYD